MLKTHAAVPEPPYAVVHVPKRQETASVTMYITGHLRWAERSGPSCRHWDVGLLTTRCRKAAAYVYVMSTV